MLGRPGRCSGAGVRIQQKSHSNSKLLVSPGLDIPRIHLRKGYLWDHARRGVQEERGEERLCALRVRRLVCRGGDRECQRGHRRRHALQLLLALRLVACGVAMPVAPFWISQGRGYTHRNTQASPPRYTDGQRTARSCLHRRGTSPASWSRCTPPCSSRQRRPPGAGAWPRGDLAASRQQAAA